MKDSFIVGPAVDEAAENYEKADGAFIWVHPKSNELYMKLISRRINLLNQLFEVGKNSLINDELPKFNALFHTINTNIKMPHTIKDYGIPMKGGEILKSSLVNPFILLKKQQERDNLFASYSNSFDNAKIDVSIKKRNTLAFLKEAKNQSQEFYDNFSFEHFQDSWNLIVKYLKK